MFGDAPVAERTRKRWRHRYRVGKKWLDSIEDAEKYAKKRGLTQIEDHMSFNDDGTHPRIVELYPWMQAPQPSSDP